MKKPKRKLKSIEKFMGYSIFRHTVVCLKIYKIKYQEERYENY